MAKLYFRYGAMGCSKTANALMVAFNYDEKGLKPLVLKPEKDNRDAEKIIKSRIGLERPCLFVEECIKDTFEETIDLVKDYDAIIVDEVQFCSVEQIKILEDIVKKLRIPVMCYGLKTDFRLDFFPASEYLLSIEDCVKEKLRTVCWCGDGAECNARLDKKGNVLRVGKQIVVGGNERYTSLCEKHYWQGNIGPVLKEKYAKMVDKDN